MQNSEQEQSDATQRLVLTQSMIAECNQYTSCFGPAISRHIAAVARAGENGLQDEVEVMRALACISLETYEQSVAAVKAAGAKASQIMAVETACRESIYHAYDKVRDMKVAHARVMRNVSLDPVQLQAVILRIVNRFDYHLRNTRDPEECIRLVTKDIRSITAIDPETGEMAGTALMPYDTAPEHKPYTADDEARAMDDTVPYAPDVNGYIPVPIEQTNGHVA